MLSGRRSLTATISPSNASTSVSTQLISYAATVSGSGPTPTGTVTFSVGDTTLCSDALTSGSASCSSSSAPLGDDTVTVSYGGDSNYSSNSTTSSIDVSRASTSTSVTPSVNPAPLFTNVTYSATVSVDSPGSGTPGGTVDFSSNGTTIGSCSAVALSSGEAQCTTEYSSAGPVGPIVATYSGGTDFTGSPSSGFTENVSLGTSSTFASVSPSAVASGATVTYSVTVLGSLLTPPVGSVAFTIGSTDLCTASLTVETGGTGSCTTSNAPLGSDETVTATYSGDAATYEGSSGTTTLSVAPPDPSPPADATGSASAAAGPGGTATAVAGRGGITGSGSGYGSLTVSTYGTNPTSAEVSDGTGTYYDVAESPGSGFSSLTITVCDPGSANSLDWFNGSSWAAFSNQSTSGGCLVATVTSSTVPTLAELTGTPVALVDIPAAPTPPAPSHGYWLVGSDGGIFSFGSAQFYGSTGSIKLQRPVVGIVPTKDDGGYWLDASDGGVFSYGDTQFYGSIPGLGLHPAGSGLPDSLNAPIVGMVPSNDDNGYFMVASDGGVFAFGDAHFAGSCPGIGGCSGAAVSVMPDARGNGYWLVTQTGKVYTFGDAPYYGAPGSTGSPVTSAVRTPDGKGYWILTANGTVYNYGDAANDGDATGAFGGLNPASAIFTTSDGSGYWIASANGTVDQYGDAPNDGGMSGASLNGAIIAATGF